jgi:hypothetical protein
MAKSWKNPRLKCKACSCCTNWNGGKTIFSTWICRYTLACFSLGKSTGSRLGVYVWYYYYPISGFCWGTMVQKKECTVPNVWPILGDHFGAVRIDGKWQGVFVTTRCGSPFEVINGSNPQLGTMNWRDDKKCKMILQLRGSVTYPFMWRDWLVVWNMNFMTFHILGIIIPTDSYFSEG